MPFQNFIFAAPNENTDSSDVIGEAFGKPVTKKEFLYYYKTSTVLSRAGMKERTDDEMRQEAWQNFIYRQGAKELGITVPREDVVKEITRLMKEMNIEYGRESYKNWVTMQVGDSVDEFEHRIEDLLAINKLSEAKNNADVSVTEKEMQDKYYRQYSSLESEYIMFDTKSQAEEFLEKAKKDRSLWKSAYDEKIKLGQKGAAWINIMSFEALIDLWKIPETDLYEMKKLKQGDFAAASNCYGIAVFRLLQKKEAEMDKYDDKKKEYYRDMMMRIKRQQLSKEYFDSLITRANYRDYAAESDNARKIEELK